MPALSLGLFARPGVSSGSLSAFIQGEPILTWSIVRHKLGMGTGTPWLGLAIEISRSTWSVPPLNFK
jgi:hypothetical protein